MMKNAMTIGMAWVAAAGLGGCAAKFRPQIPAPVVNDGTDGQGRLVALEEGGVLRVGGDAATRVLAEETDGAVVYRFEKHVVDTALPVGYPAPTPPGTIDLKRYPAVRRAEVARTDDPDGIVFGMFGGMNAAFWPLFRHIQSRDIPMTAPVEVDGGLPEERGRKGPWTMSFLYREAEVGAEGETERGVVVRDAAPVMVLSLGVSGMIEMDELGPAVESLRSWIAATGAWAEAGPVRVLYYNDPFTNPKWSEVQMPVGPAEEAAR